jgi:hypothetical protein
MDNRAAHDLERQLASWKESVRRTGSVADDDLLELESHLRDSIRQLASAGLSTEEALLVALRRIGDPGALAAEFQKVGAGLVWGRRLYWMTAGFLGFSIALEGIRALSAVTALVALPREVAMAGLLTIAIACYAALSLGVLRSAVRPAGRVARASQRVATWVERHPFATAAVAFALLITLDVVSGVASGRVFVADDGAAIALAVPSTLAATLVPVVLFLLARRSRAG